MGKVEIACDGTGSIARFRLYVTTAFLQADRALVRFRVAPNGIKF